jgi:dCMP deaminase
MGRPTWDEFYLQLAEKYATRGTCNRLQVGCVIVKNQKPVGWGYNGSIHGHPHCTDVGCLLNEQGRCIRTLHAEENAILHTDRHDLDGATAYVTHEPCESCVKRLSQVGIKRVVYRHAYENKWNQYFNQEMEWTHLP